jgi:hypothetical protein
MSDAFRPIARAPSLPPTVRAYPALANVLDSEAAHDSP